MTLKRTGLPSAVGASRDTALLVIDAQESFRNRPYWSDADAPAFFDRLQALIDFPCRARRRVLARQR
jgi:hypothetical protein